jgi:plastocyanin
MNKRIKRIVGVNVILLLSLILLTACGGGGSGYNTPSPSASTVQSVACTGITASATVAALASSFSPTGVTITVNQVVQWNNNSGSPHTVTRTTQPAGGTFDVALNNLTSVCLKFTTAGVFDYYCKVHGVTMNGSVTVN